MHTRSRLALAAIGLALAPLGAFAQHIELLTESTVTFVINYTTSVSTTTGTGDTRRVATRSYPSKATEDDIVKGMQAMEPPLISRTDDPVSWNFVAVRSLPADLIEVDSEFALYAAKGSQRIPVPASVFMVSANPSYLGISPSVTKSVTTHSTRNIIRSSGTATYYTELSLTPSFVRTEVPEVVGPATQETVGGATRIYTEISKTTSRFTVTSMFSTGFATIPFKTPNQANPYGTPTEPVTFFILGPNFVFNAKGDFSGSLINTVKRTKKYITRGVPDVDLGETTDDAATLNVGGHVNVKISLGPPVLVPRSNYGDSIPF